MSVPRYAVRSVQRVPPTRAHEQNSAVRQQSVTVLPSGQIADREQVVGGRMLRHVHDRCRPYQPGQGNLVRCKSTFCKVDRRVQMRATVLRRRERVRSIEPAALHNAVRLFCELGIRLYQ